MSYKINWISFVFIIWMLTTSLQIEASFFPCTPLSPPDRCRKIDEISGKQVSFHICGAQLTTALVKVCRLRRKRNVKPRDSKVILDKQRADGFLTSQQVTKRNFDLVEECCREGCVLEELLEYCKYF